MNVIYKGIKPTCATPESAGYDLQSVENVTIYPNQLHLVRTGLRTKLPAGTVALVFIRSSVAKKGLHLENNVAVIDADYIGEWMLMLRNHGASEIRISEGDRLAQAVFIQHESPVFIEGNIEQTERGEGGIGSTGKN